MPDVTPPVEAAHDSHVLLMWLVGVLIAALVFMFWQVHAARNRHEAALTQQIADHAKETERWTKVEEAMRLMVAGMDKTREVLHILIAERRGGAQ